MFYSKEIAIAQIEKRINVLKARGEVMNASLINALLREKRNIEKQN